MAAPSILRHDEFGELPSDTPQEIPSQPHLSSPLQRIIPLAKVRPRGMAIAEWQRAPEQLVREWPAMLLAQREFDVQVFKKQDVIGGRNTAIQLGDHRFELGPRFVTMKFLHDEFFAEAGRTSSDHLQFRKPAAPKL